MAMSNAERQRQYRKRQRRDVESREIRARVNAGAKLALDRLARRDGVTQGEVLERLLDEAEREYLRSLDQNSPEWKAYFSR